MAQARKDTGAVEVVGGAHSDALVSEDHRIFGAALSFGRFATRHENGSFCCSQGRLISTPRGPPKKAPGRVRMTVCMIVRPIV